MKILRLAVFFIFILSACSNPNMVQIVIADDASVTERLTAEDLKEGIELVTGFGASIVKEADAKRNGRKFILGTATSNEMLKNTLKEQDVQLTYENPGSRGGLWQRTNEKTIILAGSDLEGMQYAVYDYSKEILGIDPLIYWTGHNLSLIKIEKLFNIENRRIEPPTVPLLVYFENDVDELANLKEPLLQYDWESYTEMIDALVRMRYNGIHLFDMLGRPEFFKREEYKTVAPDYQLNLSFLDSMIDYAHDRGMKVQIDMALGYQIKPMDSQYADCWTKNKQQWINTWQHYLTETPISKADIFSLRPRNQVWDWEYKSTCEEDKIAVFNEVFAALDSVLYRHKPNAIKVAVCYHDSMEMFNHGFEPPEDWIIAWSDDGYAGFKYWPESTKGYKFGTYMHAGFWKNHTVADPYPGRIDTIMHKMFDQYQATSYCQVNGQQFRPFLLNLEAFSEVCRDPDSYTGEGFYQMWLNRYFPDSLHTKALRIMHDWHMASLGQDGYVESLWEIREAIAYLSMSPIERPGKLPIAYGAENVENDIGHVKDRFLILKGPLHRAVQLLPKLDTASYFFYDQVYLPIHLYYDLLKFERILHEMFRIKRSYEKIGAENYKNQAKVMLRNAREQLAIVYQRSIEGDRNPRWKGWYDPAKRRPNNGFPTMEMLDQIEQAINEKW